jgi:phosphohistidine phosphatase
MRHGQAVEKADRVYEDKDRPLTKEGVKKLEREAEGLREIVESFDAILTSPMKRAYQTGAIIAESFGIEKKLEICNELSPRASFSKLMEALEKYKGKNNILLVGHEPDITFTISTFLAAKNPCLILKKGGVCRINITGLAPKYSAEMAWLLQPKVLRMIGGKR